MQHAPKPRSAFHAGQFVKVQVTSQKAEVGSIETLDDNSAVVVTRSGFRVTRSIAALVPAWLIVLDLNGVLGYRKTSKVFHKRPHVDELLQFLFKNFVVGVWTSCTEANGVRIIADVFGDYEHRLLFRMFRDECTPNPTQDNRYGTFKDLRRVWDRYHAFDAGNTIMIDDSEDKCSHRHNALCPTPYSDDMSATAEAADVGLREIITVLDEALRVGSLEPLRTHMMRRWADQESSTPPLGVTPLTSEVSFTYGATSQQGVDPLPPQPLVSSSPATHGANGLSSGAVQHSSGAGHTASSANDGPFGQPKKGGNRPPAPRSKAAAIRVAHRARQDADDSDEERGRPSVGNTPLAAQGNLGTVGNSPPLVMEATALASSGHHYLFSTGSPSTRHGRQQSVATPGSVAPSAASPPTLGTPGAGGSGGVNISEKITTMMQRIALQRAQQHAEHVRTRRASADTWEEPDGA